MPAFAQAPETLYVTGSRLAATGQTFNGSISQLSDTDPARLTQVHIQESLLRVPGVNIQRGEGQEYLPALRSPVLTGSGACAALLSSQDGIALRAAGFCNVNELFDANSETATRIEVIRGPANALYGSNALHGVVNLVTSAISGEQANRASLVLGPDSYAQSRIQLGESGQWGLNLVLSEDGGYRDDSGFAQQKLDAYWQQSSGKWDITHAIALSNLNQETAGYVNGANNYLNDSLVRQNANPEAFRDAAALRAYSRFENTDHGWLLTLYGRHNNMDFLQHFLPGTPLEENGHTSLGLQSLKHLSTGWGEFNWGMDAEWTHGWLRQQQDGITTGSAFLVATVPSGKHYDYEVSALQLAPFVQSRWQISDDLALHAGARLESMRYEYDNHMLDGRTREDGTVCGFGGCRYSRPADRNDQFNNLGANLGAIWQLTDSSQLDLRVASAWRAPQTSELYRLRGDQIISDVRSEKLRSIELAWQNSSGLFRQEIALYAMQKDNVIFRDTNDFYVSDGKTRHLGAEVLLAAELNAQWHVGATANWGLHTYRDSFSSTGANLQGNRIESAPVLFGSVQLSRETDSGRLEAEWVYTDAYYLDPQNSVTYPGHSLFNLRAEHQMGSVTVGLKLENLLDKRYADRADYTVFSGPRYFPGQRRALYVSAALTW